MPVFPALPVTATIRAALRARDAAARLRSATSTSSTTTSDDRSRPKDASRSLETTAVAAPRPRAALTKSWPSKCSPLIAKNASPGPIVRLSIEMPRTAEGSGPNGLPLIRVCREGEAIAVAAGLCLGGRKPIVLIQCTGLFEAGDALRNAIHDLKLPLFLVVGVRNYYAHQKGTTTDSCPVFTEPILRGWQIPYVLFDRRHSAADLAAAYRQAQTERRAGAALIAE